MPLEKSKSAKAFKDNIKAEIGAGKPQRQAVAIAYAVKRRAGGKDSVKTPVKRQSGKYYGAPLEKGGKTESY